MKDKEAFARDKEIDKAWAEIERRMNVGKELLDDPELAGMLGLDIDRKRVEEVVESFGQQIATLKEERATLIEVVAANRRRREARRSRSRNGNGAG